MGRPKTNHVLLTREEREFLTKGVRANGKTGIMAKRCRILLELDESEGKPLPYSQIAAKCGTSQPTVCSVAKKFAKGGIDAALEYNINPNSADSIRKVTGRDEAEIYKLACGPVPDGRSRWTVELLNRKVKETTELDVSDETVRRVLKKGGLSLTS